MSTAIVPGIERVTSAPLPLVNGERMNQAEFHRRWNAIRRA